jgi:hypothetical protein
MKIRIIITLLSLFIISQEIVLGQSLQFSISDITCNGQCNGSMSVNQLIPVNCGNGPFQYEIVDPISGTITSPVTSATSFSFPNLCAGTYTLNILVNGNICESAGFNITQPQTPLTLTSTQVNVGCAGNTTGSINVTVVGGTPGYTYFWTGPSGYSANTQDLLNLAAGTYTLTATDANACTATTSATITEPLPILLTGSVNGNNIDISVSGGTVPYNYSWSNGAVTQDLPNVLPGTYVVIVTDAFNCSITDTFIVNNVGLEQQESIELQVFPNPAQDVVTIRSSSAGIGNTYRMLDCYGRNVAEGTLTSQENNINIQTLANGVYHVKCGSETRALVISH